MKRQTASDRVVRKALLQARAQIQRYEVTLGVQQVQASLTPRSLIAQVLPGLLPSQTGSGSAFVQAGEQLAGWYTRYPGVASAATWVLGRIGKGRALTAVGVALAVGQAMSMARRRR